MKKRNLKINIFILSIFVFDSIHFILLFYIDLIRRFFAFTFLSILIDLKRITHAKHAMHVFCFLFFYLIH